LSDRVRILVVDADPTRLHSAARLLEQAGYSVDRASSGAAALAAVQNQPPELLLLACDLPSIDGLEACRRIKQDPALADTFVVIVLAATAECDGRAERLAAGADAHILHPVANRDLLAHVDSWVCIQRLTRALRLQVITEPKRTEAALAQQRHLLSSIMESSSEAIFAKDLQGRYDSINEAGARMLGYRAAEVIGHTDLELLPAATARQFRQTDEWVMSTGKVYEREEIGAIGGKTCVFQARKAPWLDPSGKLLGVIGISSDISEHKRAAAEKLTLEGQLQQAQKMESIGRLAGGVAHDFNNLLMGIMNYVELCRDGLPPAHPVRDYLDEISLDSQRSADIIQNLLGFARKQTIVPQVLNLNDALADMLKMLRRLMGADIALTWTPGLNLWPVKIDPSQTNQILANLCINARDAISGVGKVTITTKNVSVGLTAGAAHPGVAPGDYVLLAVGDDGCGMGRDVLDHIFEPFFTTKESGKGTGLGLATVYGIVNQNAGWINVQSEPGKGAVFTLYLPRATVTAATVAPPAALPHGTETILLAEDEKSVRLTTCRFLELLGYTVLAAASPEQALCLAGAHAGPIHLLISDVIMPGMNGRDLAVQLAKQHPKLKNLFMSGYTADVIVHRGVLDVGMQFLPKPFSRHELAHKVRDVLDT
jgi:PAS domain S-box-containing protein